MDAPSNNDPHKGQPLATHGPPPSDAVGGVIAVHGRGSTADNILLLANVVPRHDLAWIAPQAAGNTWYPNSFLAPLERNEPWLSSALGRLADAVARLEAEGIPAEKTVLVGFSQGACLAAEFVARNPRRYGGLIVFSGGLIGSGQAEGDPPNDKLFDYDGSLEGTPVFAGCSDVDPHIPAPRVELTAQTFDAMGAAVTARLYPGAGHDINDDEIKQMRGMLTAL